VPRVSENIEVRALIDRFLEHGRAFHFVNGGKDEVYMASADWMPRNFHRRVEAMIPIEDPLIRTRLIEILQLQIDDDVKNWLLRRDGTYERVIAKPGATPVRSQARFIEMTRDRVKVFEAAAPSARFHHNDSFSSDRTKLEGKSADGRRRRREGQLKK
jgi:polyphosphate kinase